MKYVFVILLGMALSLFAKEPKLELGLGVAYLSYPDYMGARSKQSLFSPFPFIRYRGENFQIEKGGVRRELFAIDGLSMDLSLGGSLPSDSDDAKMRQGMPDLDLTFEFGPRVTYQLYKDETFLIAAKLPMRAVFSTDFSSIDAQGFLTSPRMRFEFSPAATWDMSFTTGPVYATKRYHGYFYSVDEAYETPFRTPYEAKGGYNSYRNAFGIKYKNKKWWIGAFASHFSLKGATYEDSPLVEQKSAFFVGTSFAYIWYSK